MRSTFVVVTRNAERTVFRLPKIKCIALFIVCVFAGDCSNPPVCEQEAELGTIGKSGASIRVRDMKALIARVRVTGGSMTEHQALLDLLWQESERQRLGLPGGANAERSWRAVVLGHQDRLKSGAVKVLRLHSEELPRGAVLTQCGRQVLSQK